ncbi:MAG: MerR family transcriptional regulator [Myxococcota bacterium]
MWAIAEVCARTGLSPRTVRYYEEIGLLPGVRRRAGGRRVYGPDELERLGFIHRLKGLGLSLAEIRDLNAVYAIGGSTAAMLARLRDLLDLHVKDVDGRIEELEALRTELVRYRDHVEARVAGRARSAVAPGGANAKPAAGARRITRRGRSKGEGSR